MATECIIQAIWKKNSYIQWLWAYEMKLLVYTFKCYTQNIEKFSIRNLV